MDTIIILGFIFIIGLVVGSFLNVVILRTVTGESIVFPGSKCPKCQTPLKWYHNIPLFSYIFLKGRCAFCKEHISLQYPLVEFLTACIFTGLFAKFCITYDTFLGFGNIYDINFVRIINYIFAIIASCMFIVISGTDIIEMQVADIHTNILTISGITYGIFLTFINPMDKLINIDYFLTSPILYSIVGTILGFLSMEIYRIIASKLVGQEAHGNGDAFILGGIGAYIGALSAVSANDTNILNAIQYIGLIIAIAVIIASLIGLPAFLKNIIKDKFTLITLTALVIYAFSMRYLSEWVVNNVFIMCISMLIFFILSFLFVREVLKGIRNHKSDGIPCPFGPSLVIASLIIMIIMPLA